MKLKRGLMSPIVKYFEGLESRVLDPSGAAPLISGHILLANAEQLYAYPFKRPTGRLEKSLTTRNADNIFELSPTKIVHGTKVDYAPEVHELRTDEGLNLDAHPSKGITPGVATGALGPGGDLEEELARALMRHWVCNER